MTSVVDPSATHERSGPESEILGCDQHSHSAEEFVTRTLWKLRCFFLVFQKRFDNLSGQMCDLDVPFDHAGVPLPSLSHCKDLGVLVDPELRFSAHLASVLRSSAVASNMIFRCFAGENPEFYLRLHASLLIPRLTYCLDVWRPFRGSDLNSLEQVQRRFLRRVAANCSIPLESLPPLPPF